MLDGSRLACPPCTDFTIVIPYNRSESKYDRTVYTPSMTGGRATFDEIEFVLTQLEELASKLPTSVSLGVISFFLIVAPLMACFYFSLFVNFMGFLIMWGLLLLYVAICSCCLVAWKRSVISLARKQANLIIQRCQHTFQAKGLRWHLPPSFPMWVELYKDYREPAFIPPVQAFQPPMIPQNNFPQGNQQGQGYPLFNQRQENAGMNLYQPPVLPQGGNQGYPLI